MAQPLTTSELYAKRGVVGLTFWATASQTSHGADIDLVKSRKLIALVSCKSRITENPASNAPTYSASEYNSDTSETLSRQEFQDLKLKIENDEKIEKLSEAKNKVELRIQFLRHILNKYSGPFRIREKDGDLKIQELPLSTQESIQEELEETEKLLQDLKRLIEEHPESDEKSPTEP